MLFAFQDGEKTIVGAASTIVEFEAFNNAVGADEDLYESMSRADPLLALSDEYLNRFKFKYPPYVIEHSNAVQAETFISRFDITLTKPNKLVDLHYEMMDAHEAEVAEAYSFSSERTTIGEMLGLDENDPWDARTEEQKQQDQALKERYEKHKKDGGVSGDDSFGSRSGVMVEDIRMSTDENGNIQVDEVVVGKRGEDTAGLDLRAHEARVWGLELSEEDKKALSELPPPSEVRYIDENGDDRTIAEDNMVSVYYVVEATGAKLSDVIPVLEAEGIPHHQTCVVRRDHSVGCWLACVFERLASAVAKPLAEAGFQVEVYGTNHRGERLIEKGATGAKVKDIVDETSVGPRPWNDRAPELDVMDEEEMKKTLRSYDGKEFIFSLDENDRDGVIIYLVPTVWFKKHTSMYPHPLNIGHVLPPDFKEFDGRPGVYSTKSRDRNNVSFDLSRRGFSESFLLDIHLANL